MKKILTLSTFLFLTSTHLISAAGVLSKMLPYGPDGEVTKLKAKGMTITSLPLSSIYPAVGKKADEPESLPAGAAAKLEEISKGIGAPVITSDKLRKIEKEAATTMFHRLNDTLSFLTTTQNTYMRTLENPIRSGYSLFLVLKSDDEIFLNFPLLNAPHPCALYANLFKHFVNLQYWIDLITAYKKSVFSNDEISSYNHNRAVAMREHLEQQIGLLSEEAKSMHMKPESMAMLLKTISDEDALFILSIYGFYEVIQQNLKDIIQILPSVTFTKINVTNPRKKSLKTLKNKPQEAGKTVARTKTEHQQQFDKIRYITSINFPTLLDGIRCKSLAEFINFTVEEFDRSFPFYKSELIKAEKFKDFSLEQLFDGLAKNTKTLQDFRRVVGLPKTVFSGIDFKEVMLSALTKFNRLKREYEEHEKRIAELSARLTQPLIADDLAQEERASLEKEVEPSSSSSSSSSQTAQTKSTSSEHSDSDEVPETLIFNEDYIKKQHAWHQKQKSNKKNDHQNERAPALTQHEKDLFTFLRDTIYKPKKHPTWRALVASLNELGFSGRPNNLGNGSTWQFSINSHNKLFAEFANLQKATFNVHEYKGNGPVHPAYLKFFRSGFSNIFGLTEDFITRALEESK